MHFEFAGISLLGQVISDADYYFVAQCWTTYTNKLASSWYLHVFLFIRLVVESYLISHAFSCTTPHVHAFGGRSCASLSCSYNLLSHQLLHLFPAIRCTILLNLQAMLYMISYRWCICISSGISLLGQVISDADSYLGWV